MYKIYYNRIVTGQITFDRVPERLKSQVLSYAYQMLESGKLTQEQFDLYFGEDQ
jgi:hypothetical protein